MKLYCANCGTPLHYARKAIKNLGIIVDLVDYHECAETPIPFDVSAFPDAAAFKPVEGKDKFVKSLNELVRRPLNKESTGQSPEAFFTKKRPMMVGTDDLKDRRFEQDEKPKSTAPSAVLDQIRQMSNSIPAHDAAEEPPESGD